MALRNGGFAAGLLIFLLVTCTAGCSSSGKSLRICQLYRNGFTAYTEGTAEDGQVLYRAELRYENGCLTVRTQDPSPLTLTVCEEDQRLSFDGSFSVPLPHGILTPWQGLAELLTLTAHEEYWSRSHCEAGLWGFTVSRADGLQAEVWTQGQSLALQSARIFFGGCETVWRFTDFAYLSPPQE
ncbi:MAG: hypothetical protein IKD06_01310 [Clostridia bacterium]|nr:hypothetical protein [Clostridia bacterium]